MAVDGNGLFGNEDEEGTGEEALGEQGEADSVAAQASGSVQGPIATGGKEEIDLPRATRNPTTPS